MFWKIIKFVIKWGLIAFAIYASFWIALVVLFGFILFSSLISGIQTAMAPSSGNHYDHYNDRYF